MHAFEKLLEILYEKGVSKPITITLILIVPIERNVKNHRCRGEK